MIFLTSVRGGYCQAKNKRSHPFAEVKRNSAHHSVDWLIRKPFEVIAIELIIVFEMARDRFSNCAALKLLPSDVIWCCLILLCKYLSGVIITVLLDLFEGRDNPTPQLHRRLTLVEDAA